MKRVAKQLFEGEGDETRLLAGRNKADGRLKFPYPIGPESEYYDLVPLSQRGSLWSWTVQRFRPKPPYNGRGDESDFTPYAVGYIELPGQLIVEGRIIASDFDELRIGQSMRVTTEAYRDENGEPVLTYAFIPNHKDMIL
ncbi:Zn-ribbon domain-containing OB-fold protein [Rhizorhapis sp. SPR117]|uniref:Zn-ribbon domain-containing OB-fold protein n=1 Tax=Rhizorhapis sp. SPR117 TaxID=2912611 RepID=UPI001F20E590|nr:OB-fold domain-containing protein [Rhizorhapis sp. SPR117]